MRIRLALAGLVVTTVACLPLFVRDASAHAQLRSAAPAAGSTVKVAPTEIVLTFSEALEPSFSTIEVDNAAGERVETGDLHLAKGNARQAIMAVHTLGPGIYTVIWHAVSVDTHRTEGRYSFTIAP